MQTLVKANNRGNQGFFIKVGERAFDFHFCSKKEEDDKKTYENYHVLQFKDDAMSFMERCGQLPFKSLEDHTQLIEEKKTASAQLKTMTQENKKLKATDTAISLYEDKFQEMNAKDQKKDAILKAERDKIEALELAFKQKQ